MMGPIPESRVKKNDAISESNDILWLSQIMENLSLDSGVVDCESPDSTGCLQTNFSVTSNDTELFEDWRDYMGDKQDPHALPMTVVYTIIFLTGIIGNVCTCIVISRNRYMHTATNYYLFSLAISDLLLLLLGLPQDISQLWSKYPYMLGEIFCIVRGWTSEASTNASILTITAFTVERYLAICHPLKAHTMSRLSRAIKFIIAIWILAALSAIGIGYQLGIIYEREYDGSIALESAMCSVKDEKKLQHSFEVTTLLFFFFPGTVLIILYVLIGLQLKRSSDMGRKHEIRSNATNLNGSSKLQGRVLNNQGKSVCRKTSTASRKDVIKMLFAVVIAFFLCWTPFHAQRLMAIYISNPTEYDYTIFSFLTNISGILYYVSATINPILYSILSLKFRHAFRDTLGRCLGRSVGRKNRCRSRTMSYFNSTLKSGMELTEDFTIVSEAPGGHEHIHMNLNGGHNGRKVSRLLTTTSGNGTSISSAEDSRLPKKKTSSTISNASLRMDAFDDASVSVFIDQMKEPY
ncbi:pyrokinin-1 receptor-like [Parasteatoda tepidariorum]|uniref:pyrokinin-1 receptor-like n=1 Tax=Parasteatoda tepidariorum TaxID=114398 RepID=UPI00077F86B9|nr:pyrokinin-1 receptor-like [Parasteatoda tepidariorum]